MQLQNWRDSQRQVPRVNPTLPSVSPGAPEPADPGVPRDVCHQFWSQGLGANKGDPRVLLRFLCDTRIRWFLPGAPHCCWEPTTTAVMWQACPCVGSFCWSGFISPRSSQNFRKYWLCLFLWFHISFRETKTWGFQQFPSHEFGQPGLEVSTGTWARSKFKWLANLSEAMLSQKGWPYLSVILSNQLDGRSGGALADKFDFVNTFQKGKW